MSILPNIVDVAFEHNLTVNSKTVGKKEVLCKCPFCLEDLKPSKIKRYYLSLNESKNTFKCWFCGSKGGVVKFISLLNGSPESEIIENLRKENGFNYKKHPAEKLSTSQLSMIGYPNINWVNNREFDVEIYKAFRDHVHQKWLSFVDQEKAVAYKLVYGGILSGDYHGAIKKVKDIEQILEVKILDDILKALSKDMRTDDELEMEMFVSDLYGKEHHFFTSSLQSLDIKTQ